MKERQKVFEILNRANELSKSYFDMNINTEEDFKIITDLGEEIIDKSDYFFGKNSKESKLSKQITKLVLDYLIEVEKERKSK